MCTERVPFKSLMNKDIPTKLAALYHHLGSHSSQTWYQFLSQTPSVHNGHSCMVIIGPFIGLGPGIINNHNQQQHTSPLIRAATDMLTLKLPRNVDQSGVPDILILSKSWHCEKHMLQLTMEFFLMFLCFKEIF